MQKRKKDKNLKVFKTKIEKQIEGKVMNSNTKTNTEYEYQRNSFLCIYQIQFVRAISYFLFYENRVTLAYNLQPCIVDRVADPNPDQVVLAATGI